MFKGLSALPGTHPAGLVAGRVARPRAVRALGTSMLAGLLMTACGAAARVSATAAPHPSGTASFALPVATIPDYPFPLDSAAFYYFANTNELQQLMYKPLYWFSTGGQPTFNPAESLAAAPVYSNAGRTLTIHLKHVLWSDGQPVTSRDVQFWLNLLIAEKHIWVNYVPGAFPDNLVAEAYPNPSTAVLTFNRAYSPTWLLYNELSQIYPIPQHAWDRTAAGQPIGNYDRSPSGAAAVYRFINAQAQRPSAFTTNPLWKVVDGPWKFAAYSPATGYTELTRNLRYFGPQSRTGVARLKLLPFTSVTAEIDALRSGSVDYGYLPINDIALKSYFGSHGYRIVPWTTWTTSYIAVNFTNPQLAPILRQLYVRQAMQYLLDEKTFIARAWDGYAYPSYGPVPLRPHNNLLSTAELHFPYLYNPSRAARLLASHGWKREAGVATCVRPGSGADRCGSGVKAGAELSFVGLYATGSVPLSVEFQALKSAWSTVGIQVTLKQIPTAEVLTQAEPCNKATGTGCGWGIADPNDFWTYDPDYYPTGGEIFGTGAGSNEGGYSNPVNDANIRATHVQAGFSTFARYENYLATELPVLWMPTPYYQVSVISKRLSGTLPQSPIAFIYPEQWVRR